MGLERGVSSFQKAIDNNNKRAIKAGAIGELTLEQLETAYLYFGGKCAYSGLPIDTRLSIEHIIPVMSGGHTLAFNCVPVINKYNTAKSGYHLLDWWKGQTGDAGKSIYNPYRLLKILNYMIKCLESFDSPTQSVYVLMDNEIDAFLTANKELLNKNGEKLENKVNYKNINQIEMLRKTNMLAEEDMYSMYDGLDNIKIDVAIFFEEALHELERAGFPIEILEIAKSKIQSIPNIYIADKKIFKKEMKPEDVRIRQAAIKWAEEENIENKYGVVGYMNFEVLKRQDDVKGFLKSRKEAVLNRIGANEKEFNNILNKIPNILTIENFEARVDAISKAFGINRDNLEGKNSEMYRYVVNKPDLILSGEGMNILLNYASLLSVDKRLLKRGIPISTIIDNIEMASEVVKKAEIDADGNVRKRILERIINNTNGNLLRDAFRNLRKIVKREDMGLDKETVEHDAACWLICMSEKYSTLELFKSSRINKTRRLYKDMRFNEEGHLIGVNPNSYIVPKIIETANLKIGKDAETELINNVFSSQRIRQGQRADIIVRDLAKQIKMKHPEYTDKELLEKSSGWFVFLSEMSQIKLDVMFEDKVKQKYIDATEKYYEGMKFDDKDNFIDVEIEELKGLVIGIDYMQIVESFFHSKGDNYIINGELVPKSDIQESIYKSLSKCRNKKEVKKACVIFAKGLLEKKKIKGPKYIDR